MVERFTLGSQSANQGLGAFYTLGGVGGLGVKTGAAFGINRKFGACSRQWYEFISKNRYWRPITHLYVSLKRSKEK